MADMHVWRAPSTGYRCSLSSVVRWYDDDICIPLCRNDEPIEEQVSGRTTLPNILLFLEVDAHSAVVNIYDFHKEPRTKWDTERYPRLLHVISSQTLSQYLPEYDTWGPEGYQIVKVAWKSACSRLCGSSPKIGILLTRSHIVHQQPPSDMTFLTILLDPFTGPRVVGKYDIRVPGIYRDVAAMAVDIKGDPLITWCSSFNGHFFFDRYRLITYNKMDQSVTESMHKIRVEILAANRIKDMRIRNDVIYFYPATVPLACSRAVPDAIITWDFHRQETFTPKIMDAVFTVPVRGVILAHEHHHMIEDDGLNGGEPTCINTALELVINRAHQVYRDGEWAEVHQGVFILKVVEEQVECAQFDSTSSQRLPHLYVAELIFPPPLSNLPSHGLKLAVSPESRRIALGAWRTLKVYAIEPLAFLSPRYSLSHAQGKPGDYAFLSQCGWEYYYNAPIEDSMVCLEPIELECSGVIHGIEWMDEDELWGWGDEGVWRWRVGVFANGRRGAEVLGERRKELGLYRK